MVATLIDVLFGCHHRRLTRPISPVPKPGTRPGAAYVACLDCGKQFHYDVLNLCIGKPISVDDTVGPPSATNFRRSIDVSAGRQPPL